MQFMFPIFSYLHVHIHQNRKLSIGCRVQIESQILCNGNSRSSCRRIRLFQNFLLIISLHLLLPVILHLNNSSHYYYYCSVQNTHFSHLYNPPSSEGTRNLVLNPFRVPSILRNVFWEGSSIGTDTTGGRECCNNRGMGPYWHQTTQIHTPVHNRNQGCKRSPRGIDGREFHSPVREFHQWEACLEGAEAKKETTLTREFHSMVSIRFWEFHLLIWIRFWEFHSVGWKTVRLARVARQTKQAKQAKPKWRVLQEGWVL